MSEDKAMMDRMNTVLQLSKLTEQLLNLALAYANNMIEYGVDVAEKWDTAARQQAELEAAYLKGRRYERKRLLSSPEKRTNGDRVREMTDEGLAILLSAPSCCGAALDRDCTKTTCFQCTYDWLKSPAKHAYEPVKIEVIQKKDLTDHDRKDMEQALVNVLQAVKEQKEEET